MPGTLFDCPTLEPVAEAEPKIVTPLGTLALDAEFDGIVIGDLKPSSSFRLAPGGYLLNWTVDDCTAELLLCRPSAILAEGMKVTDCWAGVWRLRATSVAAAGIRPEFSCRWEAGYQATEGGPNNGEGLDAQTWENTETLVTVGTMDCEWLSGQAECGLQPSRWANIIGWNYNDIKDKIDPVLHQQDGFRIILPELNTDETCQVQFIVAWAPKTGDERKDVSTWYAVDQRPEDILSSAGCR